ncbi:peptidylprolyl isomerase [Flavicella sp.]|uniref:peptidylprolyl isomerase n=1 Tax=Flavicella sp. TaxID=2957742 RepID=UPI00301B21BA
MKKFYRLTNIFLIIIFISCKSESKQQTSTKDTLITKVISKTETKKKYILPRDRKYIFDSITTDNAVEFFTQYGKENPQTKLRIDTHLGSITVRLYKDTPIHRASFLYLVKSGYYNSTSFYRVVPDFIVQGGNSDNLVTPAYKEQLHNYRIPAEFRKKRSHKRGCIAAARDWVNNPTKESTPFEFYFIQADKNQSHLNFEHTVFGEIIDGIEVIDKITQVKIDRYEWPEKEITMKITILD